MVSTEAVAAHRALAGRPTWRAHLLGQRGVRPGRHAQSWTLHGMGERVRSRTDMLSEIALVTKRLNITDVINATELQWHNVVFCPDRTVAAIRTWRNQRPRSFASWTDGKLHELCKPLNTRVMAAIGCFPCVVSITAFALARSAISLSFTTGRRMPYAETAATAPRTKRQTLAHPPHADSHRN